MKWIITFLVLISPQCILKSQFLQQETANSEDVWDVYIAQYDDGPGSTMLNMSLINRAPVKDLPFIIVTGVTYQKKDKDGFPLKGEFDNLYKVSDKILEVITKITHSEIAGTFTQNGRRLDYIYVRDTIGLRQKLLETYKTNFNNYKSYINIKNDRNWDAYLKFLYPNEETLEYMGNQKVVLQLAQSGDKLSKPRQVDHWLYFANTTDRSAFKKYALSKGFKIEGEDYSKESKLPYKLHISRPDLVNLDAIHPITMELHLKAKELHGEYDGWETFVVKD